MQLSCDVHEFVAWEIRLNTSVQGFHGKKVPFLFFFIKTFFKKNSCVRCILDRWSGNQNFDFTNIRNIFKYLQLLTLRIMVTMMMMMIMGPKCSTFIFDGNFLLKQNILN